MTQLERLQALLDGKLPRPPIATLVGMDLTSVGEGTATFVLDADAARHGNPMGTVHGGVLADLADAAMGCAFASTLTVEESFTTLELKINFLKPVFRARLTAVARVVKRGSSVGLVECDITDEKSALVARVSSTCMVLRGDKATGREVGSGLPKK